MSQVSGSALESSQVSNETSTQDREMESVEGIKTRPVPHLEAETLPGDPVPQSVPSSIQVQRLTRYRNLWDPNLPVLAQDSRTNPGPYSSTLPAQSSSAPEDDSRYPEVRTSVHSTDISDPTSTPRAWALGLIFSVLLPGVNQFFFYRYPSVQVQGIVAQLLAHPLGLALGRLPWRGEWNPKEHTLVSLYCQIVAELN